MKRLLPMTTAMLACMLSCVWVLGIPGAANAARASIPNWWVRDALCVHHYEGSWQDPSPPFWGGMQMNYDFQTTYGSWAMRRWGTADHWPVWAQLRVAFTAWKTRGWWPWPNTARYCGLL